MSARRAGVNLTVGVLGSYTPINSPGLASAVHVAGVSFIGAQYEGWGAYLAPEFGSGAGYRSTMLGGGLSRDLLSLHQFRLTALAGYTTYASTPTAAASATAPATQTLQGPSLGGMASIPLLGPVRLGYRGQYVILQSAGITAHVTRHSVGLLF
jgi:hypothetical protein